MSEWRVEITENGSAFLICGDDEVPGFAEFCNEPEMLAFRIDRLKRIAACVNACDGIPSEKLGECVIRAKYVVPDPGRLNETEIWGILEDAREALSCKGLLLES